MARGRGAKGSSKVPRSNTHTRKNTTPITQLSSSNDNVTQWLLGNTTIDHDQPADSGGPEVGDQEEDCERNRQIREGRRAQVKLEAGLTGRDEQEPKEYTGFIRTQERGRSIDHSPSSEDSIVDIAPFVRLPGLKINQSRGSPAPAVDTTRGNERTRVKIERESDDGDDEDSMDPDDIMMMMMMRLGQIRLHEDECISFSTEKRSKLAFWQTLCVQFGLARLPFDPKHPLKTYEDTVLVAAYDTFAPDPNLPIVPSTLTKCYELLHQKAHANILQYWAARDERVREIMEYEDNVGPRFTREMLALRNNQGVFAHLVHASASALIRHSVKTGQIIKKKSIKAEWLQPLMRTFNRH